MATIKDVAERSGVTVTTVSRVLNNRGYISDKTRKKVQAVMEELDYHPNEVARALLKKHTKIIGIIVPSLLHPFFSAIISYCEYYASQKGYIIMACISNNDPKRDQECIDMLLGNRVAGIILCGRESERAQRLAGSLPAVSLERTISPQIPSVLCDSYQGGRMAAQRLIDAGCRHLGVIAFNTAADAHIRRRVEGFLDVCSECGTGPVVTVLREQDAELKEKTKEDNAFFRYRAARQSLDDLYDVVIRGTLEQNPLLDGVFCPADMVAAHFLQVCAHMSIKVPAQMSVIGYDDVLAASLTTPQLTTVHQPIEQMCYYAVDAIFKQIDSEVFPVQMVLPVTLTERESVRGAAQPLQNTGAAKRAADSRKEEIGR